MNSDSNDIIYKKVGKKYFPMGVDTYKWDILPVGAHLIVIDGGCTTRKYNIDPDYAPMLAAVMYCRDELANAIGEATSARPRNQPITELQRKKWEEFAESMGESLMLLQHDSTYDVAEKVLKMLIARSDELLKNESVKLAHDQFLFLSKLSK